MEDQNKSNALQKSQPRSFATAELTVEKIKAVAETKMDSRHDHLNKLPDVK